MRKSTAITAVILGILGFLWFSGGLGGLGKAFKSPYTGLSGLSELGKGLEAKAQKTLNLRLNQSALKDEFFKEYQEAIKQAPELVREGWDKAKEIIGIKKEQASECDTQSAGE